MVSSMEAISYAKEFSVFFPHFFRVFSIFFTYPCALRNVIKLMVPMSKDKYGVMRVCSFIHESNMEDLTLINIEIIH